MKTLFSGVTLCLAVIACGGGGGDDTPPDSGGDTGSPDAACSDGEVGCACVDGSCTSGECVLGMCVDCNVAEEGCACRSTGACDAGLRCNGMDVCETCPAGEDGCPCAADDTCDDGLVCAAAGTCMPSTCTDGAEGCACRSTDPACDGTGICNDSSVCEACADDVPGCPCTAGACTGGLVCESGTCRDPLTCADLRADGSCDTFARCDEGTGGADAVCTSTECIAEYRYSTVTEECVACVSAGCTAEPTCTAGAAGSIADDCIAERKACEEDADGVGACTTCLPGFAMLLDGSCDEVILCEDSSGDGVADTPCADTEYCDTSVGVGACTAWPCPSLNQAQDSGMNCVSCPACSGEGLTGRLAPFTTGFDSCLCETRPGYFWSLDNEGAELCDTDGDGWVQDEVRGQLDNPGTTRGVRVVRDNARCDVRSVDRVLLKDEYGITATIRSCQEGVFRDLSLEPGFTGTPRTCTPFPLRLFEATKIDDPASSMAPGGYLEGTMPKGRDFQANELNSLTKACVGLGLSFNGNDIQDIDEVHPTPADTSTLMDESQRLSMFTFFVELYRMSYQPPAGAEEHGHLLIEERSRCDSDFPLGYDVVGGDDSWPYEYDMPSERAQNPSYWRNCERRRDPAFDADASIAGNDFGEWTCVNTATGIEGDLTRSGSCGVVGEVPAHASVSTVPGAADPLLTQHGLCEIGDSPPADGLWRGMNHHSQFKCVSVLDGLPTKSYEMQRSAFMTQGALGPDGRTLSAVFNDCQLSDLPDGTVDPMSINPWDPVLACDRPLAPIAGDVGFASLKYMAYGNILDGAFVDLGPASYRGACVNEDAEWTRASPIDGKLSSIFCPTPEFAYCPTSPTVAFGRYHCFEWDNMFLWADDMGAMNPADPVLRYELGWADDPSTAGPNGSVWNPETLLMSVWVLDGGSCY